MNSVPHFLPLLPQHHWDSGVKSGRRVDNQNKLVVARRQGSHLFPPLPSLSMRFLSVIPCRDDQLRAARLKLKAPSSTSWNEQIIQGKLAKEERWSRFGREREMDPAHLFVELHFHNYLHWEMVSGIKNAKLNEPTKHNLQTLTKFARQSFFGSLTRRNI